MPLVAWQRDYAIFTETLHKGINYGLRTRVSSADPIGAYLAMNGSEEPSPVG
jgi:hypothetical protein